MAAGPGKATTNTVRGAVLMCPDAMEITTFAEAGDVAALRCFEVIGTWLGRGLAGLAAILDPGLFVIGGGVSAAGEVSAGGVTATVSATAWVVAVAGRSLGGWLALPRSSAAPIRGCPTVAGVVIVSAPAGVATSDDGEWSAEGVWSTLARRGRAGSTGAAPTARGCPGGTDPIACEAAVGATKSLDQKGLAKYLRENEHKTIVGPIAFAADGERKESATLQAQFRGVKDKNIEQFRSSGKQVILFPDKLKTGDLISPFEAARK